MEWRELLVAEKENGSFCSGAMCWCLAQAWIGGRLETVDSGSRQCFCWREEVWENSTLFNVGPAYMICLDRLVAFGCGGNQGYVSLEREAVVGVDGNDDGTTGLCSTVVADFVCKVVQSANEVLLQWCRRRQYCCEATTVFIFIGQKTGRQITVHTK